MISPLLPPKSTEAPMLLETEFAPGMHLFIGATSKLSSERPGNGGFRIWKYNSKDEAAAEVCPRPGVLPSPTLCPCDLCSQCGVVLVITVNVVLGLSEVF